MDDLILGCLRDPDVLICIVNVAPFQGAQLASPGCSVVGSEKEFIVASVYHLEDLVHLVSREWVDIFAVPFKIEPPKYHPRRYCIDQLFIEGK